MPIQVSNLLLTLFSFTFAQVPIFVTNTPAANGNGGTNLATFNALCQSDADAAGLPGTWQVLISYTGNPAYDSLPAGQAIVNTATPIPEQLAADRDALFPQSGQTTGYSLGADILHPDGSLPSSGPRAWTGARFISSEPYDDRDCDDWTSSSSSSLGVRPPGNLPRTNHEWFAGSGTNTCDSNHRLLYCFSTDASMIQDPVFNGFDGSHFEFQGLPNQFFNLISTKDFQMNAKFIPWNHGSVVGAVGFKVGSDEIYVDLNRTVLFNDQLVKETIIEDTLQVQFKGDEIEISARAFRVTIQVVDDQRLDMKFGARAKEIQYAVHGVLGQTINNIGGQPKQGQDNMGLGAIEGTYVDYIEEEMFSVGSTFSRFNTEARRNLDKKNAIVSDEIFTASFH